MRPYIIWLSIFFVTVVATLKDENGSTSAYISQMVSRALVSMLPVSNEWVVLESFKNLSSTKHSRIRRSERKKIIPTQAEIDSLRQLVFSHGLASQIEREVQSRQKDDSSDDVVTTPSIDSSPNGGLSFFQILSQLYDINRCRTPDGSLGSCGDIRRCVYLILDFTRLRQSICFQNLLFPGVCCPSQDGNPVGSSETTTAVPSAISTTTVLSQIQESAVITLTGSNITELSKPSKKPAYSIKPTSKPKPTTFKLTTKPPTTHKPKPSYGHRPFLPPMPIPPMMPILPAHRPPIPVFGQTPVQQRPPHLPPLHRPTPTPPALFPTITKKPAILVTGLTPSKARSCGTGGRDARIVGGEEAQPGQWPWMV